MIVFYISGHGFGHASRDIEVINAILDRRPDLPVVIRTSAARWLFDLTLRHPVTFERSENGPGIVQIDSLRLDAEASVKRAAVFYRDLEQKASREAEALVNRRARLVVADIPPLAVRAAALAGIPAIALGNFTWDWIYAGYDELLSEAPGLVETISRAYETAQFGIRLPMHGGFHSIRDIRDVPFVARKSRKPALETRTELQLGDRPIVLLSFGGHGLEALDLTRIDAAADFTIVTTGASSSSRRVAGKVAEAVAPGVVEIDERGLYRIGMRYEDLVAAADVVVTKPGYGIISECLANDTAMLYTSRGRFAEYEVLVEAIPHFLRTAFIDQRDLHAGRWRDHLNALLRQPPPAEKPPTDGASVAASLLLAACGVRS